MNLFREHSTEEIMEMIEENEKKKKCDNHTKINRKEQSHGITG